MEKIKVRESIRNNAVFEDTWSLSELKEFISAIEKQIPEECIDTTMVEFMFHEDFARYDLYYYREETDKELEERNRHLQDITKEKEEREKQIYLELKKKFEST